MGTKCEDNMAAKNDITGDSISSKVSNQKLYAENWDKIFKKKTVKKKTVKKKD
jgi:hypothetical protein